MVAPYFLFSGVLVSRIRQHTERVAEDHPSIEFVSASYLGDHPKVVETFRERVEDVIRGDTAMNCSLCKYRAQVLGLSRTWVRPRRVITTTSKVSLKAALFVNWNAPALASRWDSCARAHP